jgi:hypothetical protein
MIPKTVPSFNLVLSLSAGETLRAWNQTSKAFETIVHLGRLLPPPTPFYQSHVPAPHLVSTEEEILRPAAWLDRVSGGHMVHRRW